jgi:hypothetical protein
MSKLTKSILNTADGLHSAGIMSDETHNKFKEYDSHSIKVLSDVEKEDFPWYMAQVLADKYIRPYEAVQRGVEVCHLTGTDISYFEDRYLKGDRSIPENETYSLAYMEILLDERMKSWIVK